MLRKITPEYLILENSKLDNDDSHNLGKIRLLSISYANGKRSSIRQVLTALKLKLFLLKRRPEQN
jgi:hypothetical protein